MIQIIVGPSATARMERGGFVPPFLERLILEHKMFLTAFEILFGKAISESNPKEQLKLFEGLYALCKVFYEDFHETKEENVLFPLLAADPSIYAGGPECVYHFDLQMMSPPLKLAERARRECGFENLEVPFPAHLQPLLEAQSPLVIPMEDHQAGKSLLKAVVTTLESKSEARGKDLQTLFTAYREIQVRHIRKEEGCLFCLTRLLIDTKTWKKVEAEEPIWNFQEMHPLIDGLFQDDLKKNITDLSHKS